MDNKVLETHEHTFNLIDGFPEVSYRPTLTDYVNKTSKAAIPLLVGVIAAIVMTFLKTPEPLTTYIYVFNFFMLLWFITSASKVNNDYRAKLDSALYSTFVIEEIQGHLGSISHLYPGRDGKPGIDAIDDSITNQFFITSPWLNYLKIKQTKRKLKEHELLGTGGAIMMSDELYWTVEPEFLDSTTYKLTVSKRQKLSEAN